MTEGRVPIMQLVLRYINQHPSVRNCLAKGLVNYSALARQICEQMDLKQFDGVVMALRRHGARLKKHEVGLDKRVISLLQSSRSIVRNKIAVLIIEKPRDFELLYSLQKSVRKRRGDCTIIEGEDALVAIVSEIYVSEFRAAFGNKIIKVTTGLAIVTILLDERIEMTQGVVAFVYGLLAWSGVNVLEEMSCWTDLMFVIEEKDLSAALSALHLA